MSELSLDLPTLGRCLGYCRGCGAAVRADSFRDRLSEREHLLAGLCQQCQDRLYLPARDLDPCDCGPVHAGAVFAAASFGEALRDVALVPFVFAPRHARLAWDLRAVVRAGPAPAALDPTGELSRLGSCRDAPHLRVLHLAAFDDPLFEARLGACSLVVVLDAAALGIAAGLCGSSVLPALVDLSRAVGWQRGFGAPLSPLDGFLAARGFDDTEDPLDWVRACALARFAKRCSPGASSAFAPSLAPTRGAASSSCFSPVRFAPSGTRLVGADPSRDLPLL